MYQDNDTTNDDAISPQDTVNKRFLSDLFSQVQQLAGETNERNEEIADRDQYIYSDKLEQSIDIPIGHDFTPVNWLKRTVQIHKTMFMGRPFNMISNYDTEDISMAADDQDQQRRILENKKEKGFAEERRKLIDSIIRDNGGHALFMDGAESASAVGTWIVKTYFDKETRKFMIVPVEAVENCYVVWKSDNFREVGFFVYAYQIDKQVAAQLFGLDADELQTSPLGSPFLLSAGATPGMQVGGNNSTAGVFSTGSGQTTGQPMVTIIEGTGKLAAWCSKNGTLYPCSLGDENELNCVFVGGKLVRLLDDPKEIPKYYIFPNKRERRRAWGKSDITDAAININVTYIETLSDWRTISSKVNFPKFKGFNFGPDSTMPKFKERQIQLLPLSEGQDLQQMQLSDGAASIDFGRQLDELKEQFVRETGISRVLFDDPSITLNSNQALLTSMKPTSDIAETKKQLWAPVLIQLFTDAINTVAAHMSEYQELADGTWWLKVQWPSVMQKEDPIFQQMLLNRKNAGTISVESYLEAQGETKEELDRIRDEMQDPVTAAIMGNAIQVMATHTINASLGIPPWGYVVPKVQLRGDLPPQEVGNMGHNFGWDQGPYGSTIGPQGNPGTVANDAFINAGMLTGNPYDGGTANYKSPAQVATQANNTPGSQPVSQPGSGATTTSPQGALNQQNQQNGG